MGELYQFCQIVNMKLQDPSLRNKKIYLYSSLHPHKRANACVLMACYSVIYLGATPSEAYAPFTGLSKFTPFHDASQYACTFELTVLDCCKAVFKAKECGILNFDTFDLRQCMYYEQVENGDLNWVLPNMCAFAGPQETREMGLIDGYSTLVPEDYVEYFKQRDVRTILRLNKKYYTAERFEKHGIHVIDLYYKDGSVPTMGLLQRFIAECERATTNIGVHCKAGLGRTGTCMGAYMMKHYGFTAAEVIAWIRICRPGSIIGPQQHFLEEIEQQMWHEGDIFRRAASAARAASGGASSAPGTPGTAGGAAERHELIAELARLSIAPSEAAGAPAAAIARRKLEVASAPDRSNQAAGLLASRRPSPRDKTPRDTMTKPGTKAVVAGR